jgi:cyclase
MTERVVRRAVGILGSGVLALGIVADWTGAAAQGRSTPSASSELEILQVRPDFYMIAGAGSNVAVQTGPDGTVIVDAGSADRADDLVAAIRKITRTPIRFVINTGAEPDHVGGNVKVSQAGQTIFPPPPGLDGLTRANSAAPILAHEGVLFRMTAPTGRVSPYPVEAWPVAFEERKYIHVNREAIEMLHQPHAHADGDSFVVFRRSDVICAGDVLDTTAFPKIDVQRGGSIQGEIDALNRLMRLAVPSVPFVDQDWGTLVIPGHGRLTDQIDLTEYRDMVTIIRDRVQAMLAAKMTLAQVQAANPTQGFTARYGSASSSAASIFVESIYTNLASQPAKK